MTFARSEARLTLANCRRKLPATHETKRTLPIVQVLGALSWPPLWYASTEIQLQLPPLGIPPFSSQLWPPSAFEGWLEVVNFAPNRTGAFACARSDCAPTSASATITPDNPASFAIRMGTPLSLAN